MRNKLAFIAIATATVLVTACGDPSPEGEVTNVKMIGKHDCVVYFKVVGKTGKPAGATYRDRAGQGLQPPARVRLAACRSLQKGDRIPLKRSVYPDVQWGWI